MTDNNNQQAEASADRHEVDEYYGMLRFVTAAALIFAAFLAFYEYYLLNADIFNEYLELSAASATWVLNNFTRELVELGEVGGKYHTKIGLQEGHHDTFVIVTSGCDASTVFAVLIATVAAWPSSLGKKLVAIVIGLLLMYGLNILRIAGMMMVQIHMVDRFDLFHEWILPGFLVGGAMAYFMFWIRLSGRHPADEVPIKSPGT